MQLHKIVLQSHILFQLMALPWHQIIRFVFDVIFQKELKKVTIKLMIRLEMKNYNTILTEKQQDCLMQSSGIHVYNIYTIYIINNIYLQISVIYIYIIYINIHTYVCSGHTYVMIYIYIYTYVWFSMLSKVEYFHYNKLKLWVF